MAEIKYEIIGNPNFLRSMDYTADLLNLMGELGSEFQLATQVNIQFEERINLDPNNFIQNEIEINDDGASISIRYITSRFHNGNGGVSNPPNPGEFYRGFIHYMRNVVIADDNTRFAELNTNNEEN